MKKINLLLITLLLLIPINVNASSKYMYVDENVTNEDVIDSSVLFAGEKLDINSQISGVGGIFGNVVNYNGKSDYAIVAGSTVTISGSFNDGAVFGDSVDFKDSTVVNRDIVIFGNNVTISGNFSRNVIIFGNKVKIENAVFGADVRIAADTLDIASDVTIAGKLSLQEDLKDNQNVSKDANIVSVNYFKNDSYKPNTWDKVLNGVKDLIKLFVVFALTLFIIPNFYKKVLANKEDYAKTLGIGFLVLILVPFAALILIMTVLGLPFGLILAALFALVIYTSTIITGYYFGDKIWKKYIKTKASPYLVGLFGITIIYILTILPIVGGLIHFLSILFGLGIVMKMLKTKAK